MSISLANGAAADPKRPRDSDLPRAVAADGIAALDDAKIIAAPDDARAWDDWRAELGRWRVEARRRIGYDGSRYARTDQAWTQRCFALCLAWLWDELLYDRGRDEFTVDRFLASDAATVGLDAIILWHTYPVIGIDDRDQFDLAREVTRLPALARAFRDRGVRVLLEYQAWDRGRPDRDDVAEIVRLVRDTQVDGVFLDTLREAPAGMRERLDAAGRGVVLEGESNIPLARIADHEMSWAQWQADSPTPGVLRAKWFEQRHMLHQTRRWDTDRGPQLRTAWLNGGGMVVWENVFGSWVGWSARDRSTWRAMARILRGFARHFSHGTWTPLADPADRDAPSWCSSRFDLDDARLWTIAGRQDQAVGPSDALEAEARDGERWFDLMTGEELTPRIRGRRARLRLARPDRPFAAVLAIPAARIDAALATFLGGSAALEASEDGAFPVRASRRVRPATSAARPQRHPRAFVEVGGGVRTMGIRYRLRETGMYGGAPFLDMWKPLPPLLHRVVAEDRVVELAPCAVAALEVTNEDYARFVDATRYRPRVPDRFLAHWSGGGPPRDLGDAPVCYVDLDDARAYAEWAGMRLPTEFEWHVAASDPLFSRGEPLVWNWTESEHADGRTRFVILKGGSRWRAEGSDWYADGGPQPPEVSFKLLRAGPAIERSPSIGFRCAVDRAATR